MASYTHSDTDIVRKYHKHINGTTEPVSFKNVVDSLEEQIVLFLGKLFSCKGFEKPVKNLPKHMEACALKPNVKEHDLALYK